MKDPSGRSPWLRRTILVAGLTALVLMGVLAVAIDVLAGLVQSDRAALVERFTSDRKVELERATHSVARSLDEVAEDVRFLGELLGQGRPLEERRSEAEALLEAVGKYKVIAVFGPAGDEVFSLRDRRFTGSLEPYAASLNQTARAALANSPGQVSVSSSLPGDGSGWLRVFATAIDDPEGRPLGVVAVLVDVAPLVSPLSALAAADTWLLALGAQGGPLPISEPRLAAVLREQPGAGTPAAFQHLVAEMRAGREGHIALSADDAAALGLHHAAAIAVFLPLPLRGGATWSVAFVSSAEGLLSRDRELVNKLGLVTAVLGGFFALLGVTLTLTVRRQRDLNEARRQAGELAHARDVIQKILDHVPTGILALRRDLTVSFVNRALRERSAAFSAGAPLGTALHAAAPEVIDRLKALVEDSRSGAGVTSARVDGLFGAEGHFRVLSVPLVQADDELSSLLVIDDLSVVQGLQDQLLRAEKLSTVGVLSAGIAHEIGTPLGVARGHAEYLSGKLAPEASHQAGLVIIIEQIDRVTRIIRQLLDFARLQPAATTNVPLVGTFESTRALLLVEAERRKLRLVVHDTDLSVAADADQLQQVLINLLMNAFDASSMGQVVELSAEQAQREVELIVRDSGAGIAEGDQRRMFDPFWTTKKRGQGTGLGLAIVAQIVRNHGGRIAVVSQPQQGTVIRVSWPCAEEVKT